MSPEGVEPLQGWSCAPAAPGSLGDPRELATADLDWVPATVPGTAAAARLGAGRWAPGVEHDFDADDWWFRCSFPRPEGTGWDLVIEGLATLGDVWLNGTHLLHTANMFRSYVVDADEALADRNELVLRCAALAPALAARRRPRPRWKAHLPSDQSLRWFRTTLIGRSPNWTPDIAPVGPWRPIGLRRRPPVTVVERHLRADHDGERGTLQVDVRLAVVDATAPAPAAADLSATLAIGDQRSPLATAIDPATGIVTVDGRVLVPDAAPWWPATHGAQPRVDARIELRGTGLGADISLGTIGFRSVTFGPVAAPTLTWNGVDVFCRGAGWAPLDPVTLATDEAELRATLRQFRDAGLNMVRLQGSFLYEDETFYALCDELGLMVWHDLMLAVLDYPEDDPEFVAEITAEVTEQLRRLQGHPCIAVVCGGNEVFQQAAMLGRPVDQLGDPLFSRRLADLVAEHLPGVPYVTGSPSWTGDAFAVDSGVAHYFGVGAYRRPLDDARTSGVRFASECLAFAVVPGDDSVDELATRGLRVGTAAWKAAAPRDQGQAWDFEDVRDHYLRQRTGIEPAELRAVDPGRYLDLGRATLAEVVGRTTSEWRRRSSPCTGALLIRGRDLADGPGFGVIDHAGRPKSAWYALRRSLQPRALLLSDEGLNGLAIEAVNDLADPVVGTLTVQAWAGPNLVASGEIPWKVDGRSSTITRADAVLGGFYDVTYAYRFGPRSIDSVGVTWQPEDGTAVSAVFLPDGPPVTQSDIGLAATLRVVASEPGQPIVSELAVTTRLTARCVLIEAPGAELSDDAFDLEPGRPAMVTVRSPGPVRIAVRAINGRHPVSAIAAPSVAGTVSDG